MIKNRKFEECSAGFADRIIAQSYMVSQKQSLYKIITTMLNEFYMPSPAFLMPAIFVLGLFLNIYAYPSIDVPDFVDGMYMNM